MSNLLGQAAPDFTMYNTQKQPVTLSSLRGKNVVLLFFPAAFTGVCTTEMCATRDNIAAYNNLDAVVFGVSTDSLFVLNKFKEEQGLNFELLSDYNKEISKLYGAQFEEFFFGMMGTSRRAAFVINREGVICHAQVLETASENTDFNAVMNTLKDLNNVVMN